MNSSKANLLNSIILIIVGTWGYFDGDAKSMTALIPVMFGVVLLLCNNGVKNQNKVIAHLAVVATFICLVGLFMPLNGAIERDNDIAVIRVSTMIVSSVIAIIFFIKSFIEARRKG
jgi:surface polysaccharide O-acyltransferase-like enzyme